jgi:hypothetical protein
MTRSGSPLPAAGRQVWNKQRKDEILIDADDAALQQRSDRSSRIGCDQRSCT